MVEMVPVLLENGQELHLHAKVTFILTNTISKLFFLIAAIVCPALFVNNGVVTYSTENSAEPFVYGTVSTYTCNDGFSLLGSEVRMCEQSSEWSGRAPICSGNAIYITLSIWYLLCI